MVIPCDCVVLTFHVHYMNCSENGKRMFQIWCWMRKIRILVVRKNNFTIDSGVEPGGNSPTHILAFQIAWPAGRCTGQSGKKREGLSGREGRAATGSMSGGNGDCVNFSPFILSFTNILLSIKIITAITEKNWTSFWILRSCFLNPNGCLLSWKEEENLCLAPWSSV